MNYLAAGLQQGFEAGGRAYENKKRRKQEEDDAYAERQLKLDMQAKSFQNARELQEAENAMRATQIAEERASREMEAASNRGWRGRENQLDRESRTGERIDAQGHQSSEAALDRAARVIAQDKQLRKEADIHDIELPLKGAALGLQSRAQAWNENPENPINRVRNAAADAKADDAQQPLGAGVFQNRLNELQRRIDENRLQQAQGDMRTGLFNWKSRDAEITDAAKEMERIRALQGPTGTEAPSPMAAPKTFGNKPGPGGLKPGQTVRQNGILWRWDGQRMIPAE